MRDSNTELNSQLGWLAAKNDLSERDYMIQTELASLNLKASQDGFLTKEVEALNNKIAIAKTDLALQQQIQQAYEEQLKTIRDLGTSVVKGASDPRITAEQKYIDAKIALENYFVTTGEITEATYLQTLKALNEQYTLEKYDIERASMDKTIALNNLKTQSVLDNYQREQDALARTTRLQEIAETNRLKNMGFTNDEAQSMAKNYVEFSKKSETEKAQWAIQQGASVLDEMGKTNKAAFQAAKAFNIANAIMNTYAGVTKALAAYPPPFNLIAAGATLAMGLAQVATIRSQQYSGRAIGGTVGKDQSYIVGERGPELFTPTGSGTITPNQNLKSQGDVSVNFTINAVDTRNFQQLLAEQKGLIVGMVRSAVNDRGRSFSA